MVLVSCERHNCYGKKIAYPHQDSVMQIDEVLNRIEFQDRSYNFKFEPLSLKNKMPRVDVKYGGGNDLDLGYMLDNISSDYDVMIDVSGDIIFITE